MTSIKKRITAALTAAILSTTLTIPSTAAEAPPIRVSSYKGSILEAGERSGLIIGPSGTDYSIISSNPDTVAEALMNAAQVCSDRRYTWHHAPEESKAATDVGYPYGFGDNLTVFTGTADAAKRAVNNWINSPGHFETMIDPRCDCIGVGVTQYDGITYCYMFVGIPNSVNFYAQPNSR